MHTINDLTRRHRHQDDITQIIGTVRSVAEARRDIVAPQSALTVNDDLTVATIATGEPTSRRDGDSVLADRRDAWRVRQRLTMKATKRADRNKMLGRPAIVAVPAENPRRRHQRVPTR